MKSTKVIRKKMGRPRLGKKPAAIFPMRLPEEIIKVVDAYARSRSIKSRAEAVRRLVEQALTVPKRAKLVDEWRTLALDVINAGLGIFAAAEVQKTERGYADEKVIALTLLARTMSNAKGAILLLDAKRIVEARTITRCMFENFYWIIGLAEERDAFVRKMRDDEMSHRRAQGQNIFAADIALEAEVGARLRDYLRRNKRQFDKNTSLSPKQVAQVRRDFAKTYIFYGQLSSDSGHPSMTALHRYIVPETNPEGGGIDVEPVVSDRELAETCEYLCMAAIGVCIAANQIVGGTPGGTALNSIADRYADLSDRTKAGANRRPIEGTAEPE
jgi:metal-responsive CopG/Arc/MetJ family transcriptional regulator